MPGAIQYILDQSEPQARTLEAIYAKEYNARDKEFKKNWKYYDGKMPNPLKKEIDGVDDNVILGQVDQISDKIVSFLLGEGITFDSGGDDQSTEEDSDLEILWNKNKGKQLQHALALSGALCGHCAVRIEPTDDIPRFVHINPSHLTVFWMIDDIEKVLWYRLQYRMGEGGAGKRIDYVKGMVNPANREVDHDADGWTELVYTNDGGFDKEWKLRKTTPWDYPWCPIVDWQNMPRPFSYYGSNDVDRAIALNDALNFVASNFNRILKHHASPKTVGTGFKTENLVETEIGGFFTVTTPEAKIYNLEMQTDLLSSRSFMELLTTQIWQSSRMMDPQTMKDKIGTLTNFGLRVLYTDAIRKTETKRLMYEEAFEQIGLRALELAGMQVPEKIHTVWPEVLPTDDAAEVKSLLDELNAGIISRQTYRDLRAYDNEREQERLEEEKAGETNLGASLLADFAKGA